jgi:hypothetical protein
VGTILNPSISVNPTQSTNDDTRGFFTVDFLLHESPAPIKNGTQYKPISPFATLLKYRNYAKHRREPHG